MSIVLFTYLCESTAPRLLSSRLLGRERRLLLPTGRTMDGSDGAGAPSAFTWAWDRRPRSAALGRALEIRTPLRCVPGRLTPGVASLSYHLGDCGAYPTLSSCKILRRALSACGSSLSYSRGPVNLINGTTSPKLPEAVRGQKCRRPPKRKPCPSSAPTGRGF